MFVKAKWIHTLFHLHAKISSFWGGELFLLRLRPTLQCQLHCPFCYTRNESLEGPLLSHSEWGELISKLPKKTVIDITGGEPLVAPEIRKLILTLATNKKKISLMTNGLNLDDDLIKLLVTQRLYSLLVSLDGPSHVHNSIRGDKTFEKVIERLDRLEETKRISKSSWPKLTLKINLLSNNLSSLEGFISELEKRYPKVQINLNLLFDNEARGGRRLASSWTDARFTSGNTQHFGFSSQELESVLKLDFYLKGKGKSHFWRPYFEGTKESLYVKKYLEHPGSFTPLSCSLPYNSLTLYGNGDISPCDLSLKIGNVREYNYDLKKVFKDDHYQNLLKDFYQKNLQETACQGCCLAPHRLKARS